MTMKNLIDANEEGNVIFGIREILKLAKKKKLKKGYSVFIAKDARDDVVLKLENAGIEFEVLKSKKDISKELGIDFNSEIFLIN